MSGPLLVFLIGSICFGVSTVFAIRLDPKLTVPAAAVIAPAVGVAGASLSESVSPFALMCVPVAIAVIALSIARRSVGEVSGHVVLFASTFVALMALADQSDESSPTRLLAALGAGAVYLVGDLVRQTTLARPRVRVRGLGRMLLLLQMVVLSACGLTVLVVSQLGWGAFIAMAGVLAITRNEFEAFGKSRTAYEQTTAALAKLKLRAMQQETGLRSFRQR